MVPARLVILTLIFGILYGAALAWWAAHHRMMHRCRDCDYTDWLGH
jgi:hypothetical protein